MLSVSHHRFSTQSSQYQNWNANKHSILTVIKIELPVWESSTKIFFTPTNSEYKFQKAGIGNYLPIELELVSFWLETHSYNH